MNTLQGQSAGVHTYIHTYIYIYNMFIVIPINTHTINNIKYDTYVYILIYNDTTGIIKYESRIMSHVHDKSNT